MIEKHMLVQRIGYTGIHFRLANHTPEFLARLEALLAISELKKFSDVMSTLLSYLDDTDQALTEEMLTLAEEVLEKPESYHEMLWGQECRRNMPKRIYYANALEILRESAGYISGKMELFHEP